MSGAKTLNCICGHEISLENLTMIINSEVVELHCPNPSCRLGLIAIYQRNSINKRLKFVKMFEEFNMLFMGIEELQRWIKELELKITSLLNPEPE